MTHTALRVGRVAAAVMLAFLLQTPAGLVGSVAAADGGDAKQDGITAADSNACMRCHWMETMAYRDSTTREIVDLSIDRQAYRHSVHAGLACRDCHDRAYSHYPHRTSSADEALTCVGCHAERGDDGAPDLSQFGRQYEHSVHAQELAGKFDCFSCHNPHRFHPVPDAAPIADVVAVNNGLCLDCHSELQTPVPRGHEWLPRPQSHWASVRCIDCHTPLDGRDLYAPSHVLLGAAESNRNCVECHSSGSALLTQLYNHRVEQERKEKGFLSQALYNDAYIVGMSRSPLVDLLGLAVVGLLLIGVAAHGFGRYLAHKRKQETP